MGQLKASGKEVVHEEEGNIVVINTCGFINNAKEESVNTILEYHQKKEEGEDDGGHDGDTYWLGNSAGYSGRCGPGWVSGFLCLTIFLEWEAL